MNLFDTDPSQGEGTISRHYIGNAEIDPMPSLSERLENGVRNNPARYIGFRDPSGRLVEVHDTDTGRLFVAVGEGWVWID